MNVLKAVQSLRGLQCSPNVLRWGVISRSPKQDLKPFSSLSRVNQLFKGQAFASQRRSARHSSQRKETSSQRQKRLFEEESKRHHNREFFEQSSEQKGPFQRRSKKGGDSDPNPGPSFSWRDLLLPAGLVFVLTTLMDDSNTSGFTDITWQEFYNRVLSSGEVDKLVVSPTGDSFVVYLHKGAIIPVCWQLVFFTASWPDAIGPYCFRATTTSRVGGFLPLGSLFLPLGLLKIVWR